MNVTPFAGKSPSDTVVGVSVDADGKMITKKVWENPVTTIFSGTYDDTENHTQEAVDVSDCGLFSLRVANTTDAAVTFTFASDVTSNAVALKNAGGVDFAISVVANKRFMMLTPDDYPFLQWIRNLRIIVRFETVPSTGTLTVYLVKKM